MHRDECTPQEVAVVEPIFARERKGEAAAVERVIGGVYTCGKAGIIREAPRFGEEFGGLLAEGVHAADVVVRGEAEDGAKVVAQLVYDYLAGGDDDLRDLWATHCLDNDVFARLQLDPGGVKVEDFAGVAKANANDRTRLITHWMRFRLEECLTV